MKFFNYSGASMSITLGMTTQLLIPSNGTTDSLALDIPLVRKIAESFPKKIFLVAETPMEYSKLARIEGLESNLIPLECEQDSSKILFHLKGEVTNPVEVTNPSGSEGVTNPNVTSDRIKEVTDPNVISDRIKEVTTDETVQDPSIPTDSIIEDSNLDPSEEVTLDGTVQDPSILTDPIIDPTEDEDYLRIEAQLESLTTRMRGKSFRLDHLESALENCGLTYDSDKLDSLAEKLQTNGWEFK